MFVHLAPDNSREAIRRSGLKPRRIRQPWQAGYERVVFAVPVTDNFYLSHQWLRELKRRGTRTLVGVYVRISDDQPVLVGHYNRNHVEMTAAEAVRVFFNQDDLEGFEVLIPRKIEPGEIHRIAEVPQLIGWRYFPAAKGRKPCGCPFCTKGDIRSRRIRENWQ